MNEGPSGGRSPQGLYHPLFLHSKILRHSRHMTQIAKREKRVALLRTKPGPGPITASAIVATVGRGEQFKNGREFVV